MQPVLWVVDLPLVGKVTFTAYFSLLTLSFFVVGLLCHREARRLGLNPDRVVDTLLWMIIWGVLGARLLHVIADGHLMEYVHYCFAPEKIRVTEGMPASCSHSAQCGGLYLCNKIAGHCHAPRDCLRALKIWQGGLVYYGGFLAALAFGVYYIRRHQLPLWRSSDIAGLTLPFGLFWGRLGCFLTGCCFGKVTHGPLGWVFPRGGASWRHQLQAGLIKPTAAAPLPVHPTQLYSALLNLGIYFVCYFWIRPRKRFDGQVFWWFVILKSVTRSLVELLRDDPRGSVSLLSTSQLISLPLFGLAVYMLRRLKCKNSV